MLAYITTDAIHKSVLSLLLATNRMALSAIFLLFLCMPSSLGIKEVFRKIFKRSSVFALLEVFGVGCAILERFSQQFGVGCAEERTGREDYFEFKVEITVRHGIFVEWHAESSDSFKFFVLKNFSRSSGNEVFLAVQVMDSGGDSCEGFKQRDLLMVDEVSPTSFEDVVRKKIDSHVDVSCHRSRILITLSVKNVIVGVRHALLNGHFQRLLDFLHPLAVTALALVLLCHDDSHLVASLAGCLHLRVHSRTYLCQFDYDSSAVAVSAWLGIGSSLPFAVSTHSQSAHFYLLHLTNKHFLQSHIDLHQFGFGFLWSLFLLLVDEIKDVTLALERWPSIFDSLFSVLIIELPLFWVCESVVCFFEVLELGRIASLVGMFLECSPSEGLLDLLSGGILCNFEQFIVLGGIDLLFGLGLGLFWLVLPILIIGVGVSSKEHTTIKQSIYLPTQSNQIKLSGLKGDQDVQPIHPKKRIQSNPFIHLLNRDG